MGFLAASIGEVCVCSTNGCLWHDSMVRYADKAGVRKVNFWFRISIITPFPHASFDFCSNLDQLAELILKRRNPSLLSGLHLGLVSESMYGGLSGRSLPG